MRQSATCVARFNQSDVKSVAGWKRLRRLDRHGRRINFHRMGGYSFHARGASCQQTIRVSRQRKYLAWVGIGLIAVVILSAVSGGMTAGRMYPPRSRTIAPAGSVANRSLFSSAKSALRQCLRAVGNAPIIYPVVNIPCIKGVLSSLPVSRALYGSRWDRKHPFDRIHGTDTSGFLSGDDILTGHPAEVHGSPYAGAQPSVLREVLSTLPDLSEFTFIDLGCGKGRPMLVASEFPFRDIVGVELSPMLAEVARKNAAILARRYPDRTPVRVDVGDATIYPMPAGNVVLFVYNSFDSELMQKVVQGVEQALAADSQRCIYVVYCNPAVGHCFDKSPLLTRRYARMLDYTPEEKGYAEDAADGVIIWQGGNAPTPTSRADAKIVIVKDRWRAELVA